VGTITPSTLEKFNPITDIHDEDHLRHYSPMFKVKTFHDFKNEVPMETRCENRTIGFIS